MPKGQRVPRALQLKPAQKTMRIGHLTHLPRGGGLEVTGLVAAQKSGPRAEAAAARWRRQESASPLTEVGQMVTLASIQARVSQALRQPPRQWRPSEVD